MASCCNMSVYMTLRGIVTLLGVIVEIGFSYVVFVLYRIEHQNRRDFNYCSAWYILTGKDSTSCDESQIL